MCPQELTDLSAKHCAACLPFSVTGRKPLQHCATYLLCCLHGAAFEAALRYSRSIASLPVRSGRHPGAAGLRLASKSEHVKGTNGASPSPSRAHVPGSAGSAANVKREQFAQMRSRPTTNPLPKASGCVAALAAARISRAGGWMGWKNPTRGTPPPPELTKPGSGGFDGAPPPCIFFFSCSSSAARYFTISPRG